MNASWAPRKLESIFSISNLFLTCPDTEFCEFLGKIDNLVQFPPKILVAIDKDLDLYGKEKKKLRLADAEFFQLQTTDLPGLVSVSVKEILETNDLDLGWGVLGCQPIWFMCF